MIPFSFILTGVLVDSFATILMIRDYLGLSDPRSPAGRGLPIGPLFYLIGFGQLVFINKKPWIFTLIVLICCLLFYCLIIFSVSILDGCKKHIRRRKASEIKCFFSNYSQGITIRNTMEESLLYLGKKQVESNPSENDRQAIGPGFIFINVTPSRWEGWTQIQVLPSGDSLVSIKESDPGHITGGHFFKRMADNGLEVDRWQIDNHKRIVIPGSDHNIIPQFIETLFQGYYGLEANCQIKAETLKL